MGPMVFRVRELHPPVSAVLPFTSPSSYADIAQAHSIHLLSIGLELNVAQTRSSSFRAVISSVRSRFHGRISFDANWDVATQVDFFDAVDVIGVDAYFPLSVASQTPSTADFVAAWSQWIPPLQQLHQRFQKPVIFAEIGYCSDDQAWATPAGPCAKNVNVGVQRDLYSAVEEVTRGDWFGIAYFWAWTTNGGGGSGDGGFTSEGKPAAEVLKTWN
jgi:hypothetical protein